MKNLTYRINSPYTIINFPQKIQPTGLFHPTRLFGTLEYWKVLDFPKIFPMWKLYSCSTQFFYHFGVALKILGLKSSFINWTVKFRTEKSWTEKFIFPRDCRVLDWKVQDSKVLDWNVQDWKVLDWKCGLKSLGLKCPSTYIKYRSFIVGFECAVLALGAVICFLTSVRD